MGGGTMMQISAASRVCGGRMLGADVAFSGAAIDSRAIGPNQLFVALRGASLDGHDFVDDATQRGACAVLAEHAVSTRAAQIVVEDVPRALGKIARAWRDAWQGVMVGITGSNGKTTVKDMLAEILNNASPTLATAGNFNNELGLPLTLLRLASSHRYAVVEMGASGPGEIARLAAMVRPELALVTNAAPAHLEGFGDVAGVARAKAEAFAALAESGTGVVNADDEFADLWRQTLGARRRVEFSLDPGADADVTVLRRHAGKRGGKLEFKVRDERVVVTPGFIGVHNDANALAALAAGHALGLSARDMAHPLARFRPPPGRLELIDLAGGLLVNDTYNANPASARAGIEAVKELGADETWLALGDMRELGVGAPQLHTAIGQFAADHGVQKLFTVGECARLAGAHFSGKHSHFDNAQQLGEVLAAQWRPGVACLVKGSRAMHMEDAVRIVCQRFDGGVAAGGGH